MPEVFGFEVAWTSVFKRGGGPKRCFTILGWESHVFIPAYLACAPQGMMEGIPIEVPVY